MTEVRINILKVTMTLSHRVFVLYEILVSENVITPPQSTKFRNANRTLVSYIVLIPSIANVGRLPSTVCS